MASDSHSEALEKLPAGTRDMHRALVSLQEELEAIDVYRQRADACADPELKTVLLHNRSEEIEHASMLMEWIRRSDGHFTEMMRTYLFTEAPIAGIEKAAEAAGAAGAAALSTGTGSRKGR